MFRGRIEAVCHRTARCLWPKARPDIVGATTKQQIEALAQRCRDCVPAGGGSIGRGPVAVREIAVIGGVLDHAVQRDVLDDPEPSHLSLRVLEFRDADVQTTRLATLRRTTVETFDSSRCWLTRITWSRGWTARATPNARFQRRETA